MTEEPSGAVTFKLYLPPNEIEYARSHVVQEFVIPISAKERFRM
jgi:hypothetical protein